MKKLTSIKSPLFNTLEKAEMKQVTGGVVGSTPTAGGPSITGQKDGSTTNDGTLPATDDGAGDANPPA